jgi:uncharacterized Tic20 family protein
LLTLLFVTGFLFFSFFPIFIYLFFVFSFGLGVLVVWKEKGERVYLCDKTGKEKMKFAWLI